MMIPPNSKLVMIGDSITDCGRQRLIGEAYADGLGNGYVSLVDALLCSTYPGHHIRVLNLGIGGNTVLDLEARWQSDVLDLRPVAPRFEAFGWFAQEINGHDLGEILKAFDKAKHIKGKPSAIIARTIKGYPLQHLLASDPNHHGKPLTKDEADKALAIIG